MTRRRRNWLIAIAVAVLIAVLIFLNLWTSNVPYTTGGGTPVGAVLVRGS